MRLSPNSSRFTGSIFVRKDNGLSLVELLVVLAIIGLLAGVIVPTVGFYTRTASQDLGARSIFTVMKAANVYASTHNVEAAVVFNVRGVTDSETGEDRFVMTEFLLARQLKTSEIDAMRPVLGAAGIPIPNQNTQWGAIFVPVVGTLQNFTKIERDAVVLGELFTTEEREVFDTDALGNIVYEQCRDENGQLVFDTSGNPVMCPVLLDITDLLSTTAMSRVRVVPSQDDLSLMEVSATPDLPANLSAVFTGRMPAYVFKPDGSLRVSGSYEKQRATITVAASPAADREERFLLDPETGALDLDENGNPIERVTPILIWQATGRIKIGNLN